MSSDKRLITFFLATFLSIYAIQFVMERTGLIPPPAPRKPPALVKTQAEKEKAKGKSDLPEKTLEVAKAKGEPKAEAIAAKGESAAKEKAKAKEPAVPLAEPSELILGSTQKTDEKGYQLELQLDQKGAGVLSVSSARFEAEFEEGKPKARPLQILKPDPLAPPSMALTLIPEGKSGAPSAPDSTELSATGIGLGGAGELPLDLNVWEVVRTDGRVVRPIKKAGTGVEGQEVTFRTSVDSLGVKLTKTFRLFKGEDGFECDLKLESPEKTHTLAYRLFGPHGIPIEGEWYTGTFRDAVIGTVEGSSTIVDTVSASEIVKNSKKGTPERFQKRPLKFAGVENQYFTSVLAPNPTPKDDSERWDAESTTVLLHDHPEDPQKSDIVVEVRSRPVQIGPNVAVTHAYRVFAGPKTVTALTPFGAEDLASYRKSNWIPFATFFSRAIITPMLDFTYGVTERVAALFGGKRGNYGVAIIMLTLIVRMAMFPLGRKQALAAKKMQDLQPHLKELQEKFKDDKEKQTKETWALYKRHGVNPVGGCLPALIQLPIFVGLWQALNNSVYLRHANFLWIDNLAAPDMLFRFPSTIPFLGDYFNLLPFLVVGLMLVQTQLFSPPATTPEAESQQKMMKYMMIFMGFMFYKVASGLGLYFITSSLWQIGERLLLPKITHTSAPTPEDRADDETDGGGGGGRGGLDGGGGGRGGNGAPAKPPGKLTKFWEKVLEEASKDTTHRNAAGDRDRDRDKSRARPGRKR
jgi:YidC/Oxa1 family membrane protein insertase